jgi:hypothetical protein
LTYSNTEVELRNMQIGRIDERGYLKGITRRGFTPAKCLSELIANSLDSMDRVPLHREYKKTIVFAVFPETVRMIDNGFGMNSDDAERMFALHNENHASDKSRGVSGVGAKPSLSLLGNRQETILFTRVNGGDYLRISVPWTNIHAEGVWTGMVTTRLMTEDEKLIFNGERAVCHGTTIEFRKNEILCGILEESFLQSPSNPLDSPGIIFGRDDVDMIYRSYLCRTLINDVQLKLYNYFDRRGTFYTGVQVDVIEHYYSPQERRDRFIWRDGDEMMEVPHAGGGRYSKEMKRVTVGLSGYHKVGEYTVHTGLREDILLFDPENPKDPSLKATEGGIGGSSYVGLYNEEHLGEESFGFLGSYKLVRNGQLIGLIEPPDICMSSARANWGSNLETCIVQTDVRFSPYSSQEDNHQDRAMNIQENKNQFDGKSLPKNFTRLVRALKKKKVQVIQEYFSAVLKSAEPLIDESKSEPNEEQFIREEEGGEENTVVVAPISVLPDFYESDDEMQVTTPSPDSQPREQITLNNFGFVHGAPSGEVLKKKLSRLVITLNDTAIYDSPEYIELSNILTRLLVGTV